MSTAESRVKLSFFFDSACIPLALKRNQRFEDEPDVKPRATAHRRKQML
jgi:hypothetical protein